MIKTFGISLFASVFFPILLIGQGNVVRLEIRNGILSFNDGTSIVRTVFNSSSDFEASSPTIVLTANVPTEIKVVNGDSISHDFTIPSVLNSPMINPGDSAIFSFSSLSEGIYPYYCAQNQTIHTYLGLAGIIHVKNAADIVPYFYWNIQEHQEEWNGLIQNNINPDFNTYDPNYFTINGRSEPDINDDSTARITGQVGEEIRVIMMNHGRSIHSMHFHGYHAELLIDSKKPAHTGRSKDTFPLYPGEHILLQIIPDKSGEYPIHDHNLVAVTGGGIYHAGMFTTILITP